MTSKFSRREFIMAAGGGAPLAAGAASAVLFSASTAYAQGHWDHEVDVVIVGSGAAGCTAALFATQSGAKVLMLEKAARFGGTSSLSGGIFYIPNNSLMRELGYIDSRDDAIRFFCRTAYPDLYNANKIHFGLAKNEYDLIATFYDQGASTIESLEKMGALQVALNMDWQGKPYPNYNSNLPEDKAPRGRAMLCKSRADGKPVTSGAELMGQLKAAMDRQSVSILLQHRATRLVMNSAGEVIGIEARNGPSTTISILARRGVIFCSGGFTHNSELRTHLRGPVFSGCGPVTNEGDFVAIAGSAGAKLANMAHGWWFPQVLELSLRSSVTGLSGGNPTGDSMIMVNRYGRRVMNEKCRYHDRSQPHFDWDTVQMEYQNMILFMVFDERTRNLCAQETPIPAKDVDTPWMISADTLDGLSVAISKRLNEIQDRIRFSLDDSFSENLAKSVLEFNGYAETGKDLAFHRGDSLHDISGQGPRKEGNDKPNPTMFPISPHGPYYAIMLCAGTLDTKGGPKIDPDARVLNWQDKPIPGLYGAGNCIGSPAGASYWGRGATIGLAMVFGAIAGRNAAIAPTKTASAT